MMPPPPTLPATAHARIAIDAAIPFEDAAALHRIRLVLAGRVVQAAVAGGGQGTLCFDAAGADFLV